jgi:DNA-binding transcriptional MerR regulator
MMGMVNHGVRSRVKGIMDKMTDDLLRIGALANLAGVSIDAIRYYERRGVLPQAMRTESNYRLFPAECVERLALVGLLQDVGFTLDEITDALHAHDAGGASCDSERWRLEAVKERIDRQIHELVATREKLDSHLDACRSGRCDFVAAGDREDGI